MKKPLVSVLMTIHNHENFLKKSIYSIICQDYKNWELIAIDNGSIDKTKKILEKIRDKRIIKKYLNKNIGRTNCLNYGLKFCKGKYIAILDSDDLAKKNRLSIQVNRMEENNNLWLTSSNYNLIDTKNKLIGERNINIDLNKNPRKILYENIISHSTVLYKKELIKKIGNYPKKFKYAQDYAFYLKAFKKFKLEIYKDKLINLRIAHKNSETFRQSKSHLIISEEIKLLLWSYKNFNLKFNEKILMYVSILKKIFKLAKLNYLISILFIILFFLASFLVWM